mmetsp:Transcript_2889/g.3948  ORF Transcript_2889/g.3948 Transcript_2889/m.3948 type:complete len:229 (+) Transcript_2889:189-875(+)
MVPPLVSISSNTTSSILTGSTNMNDMIPPNSLSSGETLSDSWIIKTFPLATSLEGEPKSPIPGPPNAELGVPRSSSPPVGFDVSKIRAWPSGVNPVDPIPSAEIVRPKSFNHWSLTNSPTARFVPLSLLSKSRRTHSKHMEGAGVVNVGLWVGNEVARPAGAAVGIGVSSTIGEALGSPLGAELSNSSTNSLSRTSSRSTSTISITFGLPPSLSITSANPDRFSSIKA